MAKERSEYYIESIKRAIQILKSFTVNEKEFGITELSKKLKLHKSTIHRIVITLEDEDFLLKNQLTQKYSLGIRLLELGYIVHDQIEVRSCALPIMKELAQKTGESVDLNIISDNKRVSIEKIESSQDIRKIIKIGKILPLYCGGSGKALLAYLPEEKIGNFTKEVKLEKLGPNTITDPKKLKEHLKQIRKNGYAISFEERVLGSVSIGAPIFDYSGKIVASLSVSGPISRFPKNKILCYVSSVKEASLKISSLLGYRQNKFN